MQDGAPHVLRFLFVHGLTTVLLLGGLGVGNQKIDLHEVRNFILFFFCVVGSQRNSTDRIQEQVLFRDRILKVIFVAIPLNFLNEAF